MINKKVAISVIVIAVMLIGSNKGIMAYADTAGNYIGETTTFTIVEAEKAQAEAAASAARATAEAEKAQAEAEATAARATAEAEKAQAEAAACAARATAEAEKAQAEAAANTARATAEAEKAQVEAEATAARATAEAEKAQAEAEATAAQATAAAEQKDTGTGAADYPVVPTNLTTKIVNPDNGDIIETSFDAETKATTTNMICARKDAPDTLTVTSPSGTDATISGDGDTFRCNVGYYGNTISPVSLSTGYKTSLKIQLMNSSEMTGEINNNNKVQYVSLNLDSTSKWIVEGTSYLSVLIDADTTLSNIVDNGNTIYYNPADTANDWLEGKTFTLSGGGTLIPIK